MAKQKITRIQRPAADKTPRPSDGSADREFSVALEVEFSKARAAVALLRADSFEFPPGLTADEEQGISDWVNGFAFDALDEALKDAEAARRKHLGPPMFGKRKKVA